MDDINKSIQLDFEYDYDNYEEENSTIILNPEGFLCQKADLSPDIKDLMCAFYVVVFLLAVCGNLTVGLVIGFTKRTLIPSDLYLFHLSVADIILALTLPFLAAVELWGWVFGEFMCKVTMMAYELSFYSSILFLVCISVDRYRVIVHAMESRKEHRRMISFVVCVGVWTIAFALSLSSALLSYIYLDPDHKIPVCSEGFQVVPRLLRHTLGFILPLVIMVACYGMTVIKILNTRGFQKQRAMRVIIAVVAAFLICWMPNHMVVIADTLMQGKVVKFNCSTRQSMDLALYFTMGIARLHSCTNPILYAFVGEKFRRNLKQLFLRRRVHEQHPSISRFSRSTSQTSDTNFAFM